MATTKLASKKSKTGDEAVVEHIASDRSNWGQHNNWGFPPGKPTHKAVLHWIDVSCRNIHGAMAAFELPMAIIDAKQLDLPAELDERRSAFGGWRFCTKRLEGLWDRWGEAIYPAICLYMPDTARLIPFGGAILDVSLWTREVRQSILTAMETVMRDVEIARLREGGAQQLLGVHEALGPTEQVVFDVLKSHSREDRPMTQAALLKAANLRYASQMVGLMARLQRKRPSIRRSKRGYYYEALTTSNPAEQRASCALI